MFVFFLFYFGYLLGLLSSGLVWKDVYFRYISQGSGLRQRRVRSSVQDLLEVLCSYLVFRQQVGFFVVQFVCFVQSFSGSTNYLEFFTQVGFYVFLGLGQIFFFFGGSEILVFFQFLEGFMGRVILVIGFVSGVEIGRFWEVVFFVRRKGFFSWGVLRLFRLRFVVWVLVLGLSCYFSLWFTVFVFRGRFFRVLGGFFSR